MFSEKWNQTPENVQDREISEKKNQTPVRGSYFAKRNIFTGKVAWNSYLTHGLRHNCVIDQKLWNGVPISSSNIWKCKLK
jgi:hypothetical protein